MVSSKNSIFCNKILSSFFPLFISLCYTANKSLINPYQPSVAFYIENSHLICIANLDWNGFNLAFLKLVWDQFDWLTVFWNGRHIYMFAHIHVLQYIHILWNFLWKLSGGVSGIVWRYQLYRPYAVTFCLGVSLAISKLSPKAGRWLPWSNPNPKPSLNFCHQLYNDLTWIVAYLGPYQTSLMELFAKIVDLWS